MTEKYCVVITTVANSEKARSMAAQIIEKRLAACVQWFGIESMYRWNGNIENEKEVMLQAKTTLHNSVNLQKHIRECHDYETPEIIVLPVHDGFPQYLNWIRDNVVEFD